MQEIKQAILIRSDLKMSKGKTAAQAAHASVEAVKRSDYVSLWEKEGSKKVILKVKDEKELKKFLREADSLGLPKAVIKDAGRTELAPGTITALAIGPAPSEELDKLTGGLALL